MPTPFQEVYDLYADQLRSLGHGTALYEPEPNESDGPVQIGDVGYIDFGRFMPFASVFLPLNGIPAVYERYREIIELAKLDKGVMSSRSVHSKKIDVAISANEPLSGASVGASLQFSCESDRGASLITRHRSINQKSKYHNVLKQHFIQHIKDYEEYANHECLPIRNLHDIVLVVGRVMTGDWATIIFDSRDQEYSASFDMKGATISASGTVWGTWSEHTSFPKRHGPTRDVPYRDNEQPPVEKLDQCIFVSPFRISDLAWYKRLMFRISTSITQKSGVPMSQTHSKESTGGSYNSQTVAGRNTVSRANRGSSPVPSMDSVFGIAGPFEAEDVETLTSYEVLAFRAFQASAASGTDFDFICIDEDDVQYFQTTACSLRELAQTQVHDGNLTVVSWDTSSVKKVGRVQQSPNDDQPYPDGSTSSSSAYYQSMPMLPSNRTQPPPFPHAFPPNMKSPSNANKEPTTASAYRDNSLKTEYPDSPNLDAFQLGYNQGVQDSLIDIDDDVYAQFESDALSFLPSPGLDVSHNHNQLRTLQTNIQQQQEQIYMDSDDLFASEVAHAPQSLSFSPILDASALARDYDYGPTIQSSSVRLTDNNFLSPNFKLEGSVPHKRNAVSEDIRAITSNKNLLYPPINSTNNYNSQPSRSATSTPGPLIGGSPVMASQHNLIPHDRSPPDGGPSTSSMTTNKDGYPSAQTITPSIRVRDETVLTSATPEASRRRRRAEANFLCPIPGCGSTFTRHFNLKGHLRSHNEAQPFKCNWPGCDKTFARQHDCKRHEQLHLDIRPYVCQGCNRTFARMDALNRHLRSDAGTECQDLQPPLTKDQPNNPEFQNNYTESNDDMLQGAMQHYYI